MEFSYYETPNAEEDKRGPAGSVNAYTGSVPKNNRVGLLSPGVDASKDVNKRFNC